MSLMMYGLLLITSCTINAKIPIWAARPWFNSLARNTALSSSVLALLTYGIPKSPGVLPSTCFHPFNSHHPMDNKIWTNPNNGIALGPKNAPSPLGMSVNLVPIVMACRMLGLQLWHGHECRWYHQQRCFLGGERSSEPNGRQLLAEQCVHAFIQQIQGCRIAHH